MIFRPKYNEPFPSIESMYETEKEAIESFCKETGIICSWENETLEISNQPENWIIRQSLIDGTVLLYHKNTKEVPQYQKTYYEKIEGYHLQEMFFVSFLYTLCYIYLHRICILREHVPFEELPPVMQEFIRFYEKEKARIPKETRKHKRHAILKARENAAKQAEALVVKELLDSLEDDPSELLIP
ncbi:hypothetical protein [Selenomonas ruminis]|uniref:Uncharacterized protein n=1 Tax=Selenomonas ruminis TaxID=2593411 RepID=A0A5D6VX41_9FIRM|nr:hypothetical protein [Selenomonas sp. mPRGC5]TYZ20226.1 hypothetical protein FZ040_12325 [Selenomonas sp. mPRGC5]